MLSVKKSWDETLRKVNSYNMKPAHSSSDKSTQILNSTDQDYTSRKSSAVSQDSIFGCDNDMLLHQHQVHALVRNIFF